MVKTDVMYLGPLNALSHTGPSGITRNFFRNKWISDDFSEDDLKHYDTSSGFKVKPVSFIKRNVVPVIEEKIEEIFIGG